MASVTETGPVKVPPFGVMVGVATVGVALIVKATVATALSLEPALKARTLRVDDVVMLNGVVYLGRRLRSGPRHWSCNGSSSRRWPWRA